jgi:hypothetical protein
MNYQKLVVPIIIFMITSWTCLSLVVLRMEPCLAYSGTTFCQSISSLAMIFFYSSLFFALTSTFTLIGYLARVYMYNNEIFASHFNVSLRQAILISFCIITCIVLFTLSILKWWTTLFVFGIVIFIELYFLNQERKYD